MVSMQRSALSTALAAAFGDGKGNQPGSGGNCRGGSLSLSSCQHCWQHCLIDEASNGRAFLGITWWLVDFVGVDVKRPVTALSEAFACVRHLLRQSTEPLAGEIFPLAGGDSLRWKVLRLISLPAGKLGREDDPCLCGSGGRG